MFLLSCDDNLRIKSLYAGIHAPVRELHPGAYRRFEDTADGYSRNGGYGFNINPPSRANDTNQESKNQDLPR